MWGFLQWLYGGGRKKKAGAGATLLGESPAAAPAKTPGMFTTGGVTYGEESMGKPREEWEALDPDEIERRREAYKPERSATAAKSRKRLLGAGKFNPAGPRLLGADDPRRRVSWRQW